MATKACLQVTNTDPEHFGDIDNADRLACLSANELAGSANQIGSNVLVGVGKECRRQQRAQGVKQNLVIGRFKSGRQRAGGRVDELLPYEQNRPMGCRTRRRVEIKGERLGKRASKMAVMFFACNMPGDLVQICAQDEAFIKLRRRVNV